MANESIVRGREASGNVKAKEDGGFINKENRIPWGWGLPWSVVPCRQMIKLSQCLMRIRH